MRRKEKYETCRHVKEVGQIAVYVLPACRNATMIKGVLVSSKNRCRKCELWEDRDEKKPWEEMTEKEINKLKADQCSKCIYLSGSIGRSKASLTNRTCDYIAHHGHSRGCSPLECVEKGVFKSIKEGKHVQK